MPMLAATTTRVPTPGPALGAALGRSSGADAMGGLRKESSLHGLPRRQANAAKPQAGRATVKPKSTPEKTSIAPATTAQAAHSATRPASTPQPRVAIMIGSGARYASANARA